MLSQGLRLQISLHYVHLAHRIADGCACRENHATLLPVVLGHDVARFDEHIESPLRVVARKAGDTCHLAYAKKVFEEVGLVDEHAGYTEFFEGDQIVLLELVRQFFQSSLPGFLGASQILDDSIGAIMPSRHISRFQLCQLLADEILHVGRTHLDPFKGRVRHDDRIPIPARDTRHEFPTLVANQVVFRRHQHMGCRIGTQELRGVLLQHVIRNHMEGLGAETQTARFHGRTDHRQRLTGTDHMGQQGIAAGDDTPNRIQLVLTQGDALREAWQGQV